MPGAAAPGTPDGPWRGDAALVQSDDMENDELPSPKCKSNGVASAEESSKNLVAHLKSLTAPLRLQAQALRSCSQLHPETTPGFREATDKAIDKLIAAVRDFHVELVAAAAEASSPSNSVPPAVAALDLAQQASGPAEANGLQPVAAEAAQQQQAKEAKRSVGRARGRLHLHETIDEGADEEFSKQVSEDGDNFSDRGGENAAEQGVAEGTAPAHLKHSDTFSSTDPGPVEQAKPVNPDKQILISGVLNPSWNGRLAWDFSVIFLVLCDGVVLPFQLAEFVPEGPFDMFWLLFTTWFFAADLVMNFFTAYVAGKKDEMLQEGTLVVNKSSIAVNYFRGWFWIDFLSTVPWTLIADAASDGSKSTGNVTKLAKVIKLTRLLRLMRMLRLAKLGVIWERIEVKIGSVGFLNIMSMLKVLGVVFAICHWGACVWWIVGSRGSIVTGLLLEDDSKEHWTELPRVHSSYDEIGEWKWVDKPVAEQYVFCFYWILGVMRTMPAEVTPINLLERTFVLFFMFFAVASFAICVARITQAWFRFGSRSEAFKEELACVRMHLRNINCDDSLQVRTQAYLRHIFQQRKIHAKELSLMGALPEALKVKIAQTQIIHHLRRVDCLKDRKPELLKRLCEVCEVLDFLPGDKLTMRERPAQACFVLMRGGLQVYTGEDKSRGSSTRVSLVLGSANKGMPRLTVIDEEAIKVKLPVPSNHTVVAMECSEVLRIDKDLFHQLMDSLDPHSGLSKELSTSAVRCSTTSTGYSAKQSMHLTDDEDYDVFRGNRATQMTTDLSDGQAYAHGSGAAATMSACA